MGKMRIVVTCPETGIAVITGIAYEDMVKPRESPMLFACPCGETHTLVFAARPASRHGPPPVPLDQHGVP
jgi:hypothetical protein